MPSKNQVPTRAYMACFGCRERKVKCIVTNNADINSPCERCKRQRKECVFPSESNRGGIGNVLAGRARKRASKEGGTKARWAASDSRFIKAENSSVPATISPDSSHSGAVSPANNIEILNGKNQGPRNALSSSDVSQVTDTLNMLAWFALDQDERAKESQSMAPDIPFKNTQFPPSQPMEEVNFIKDGPLSRAEVALLVDFYITRLHPFFPFYPKESLNLHSISGMEFVLTVICYVALLYYIPDEELDPDGDIGNGHDNVQYSLMNRKNSLQCELWSYLKSILSFDTLFELPDGPMGTVFALLLIAQWSYVPDGGPQGPANPEAYTPDSCTSSYMRSRRNDRMAWLFLGVAIRVAESTGILELNVEIFSALRILDISLSSRLGRPAMIQNFVAFPVAQHLQFNEFQISRLELLKILGLGSRLLFPSFQRTRENIAMGNQIYQLTAMKTHIELWSKRYQKFLSPQFMGDHPIEAHEISFLYHHMRIFVYRLALPSRSQSLEGESYLANYDPCEQFIFSAIESAKEILTLVEQMHEEKLLRLVPLSWCAQMIHATIFLVKAVMLCPTAFHGGNDINVTLDRILMVSEMLMKTGPTLFDIPGHFGTVMISIVEHIKSRYATPRSILLADGKSPQRKNSFMIDFMTRYPNISDGFNEFANYGLDDNLNDIIGGSGLSSAGANKD